MKKTHGKLIWITGLIGSGKTTLALRLVNSLKKKGLSPVFIDGDKIRKLFGNNLGYSLKDRIENAFRIARICHLLTEQGFIVICATVSLFHQIHDYNRKTNQEYYEIYLEVNVHTLKKRNQKNLYKSKIANVVGKDQIAEIPKNPSLICKNDTKKDSEKNVLNILKLVDMEK